MTIDYVYVYVYECTWMVPASAQCFCFAKRFSVTIYVREWCMLAHWVFVLQKDLRFIRAINYNHYHKERNTLFKKRQQKTKTVMQAKPYAAYGRGTGSVYLSNTQCRGNETNLGQCQTSSWGNTHYYCPHDYDAGVSCHEHTGTSINPKSLCR